MELCRFVPLANLVPEFIFFPWCLHPSDDDYVPLLNLCHHFSIPCIPCKWGWGETGGVQEAWEFNLSPFSSLKIMWKHFPPENMFMQHQHQKAIFLFSLMTLSDMQQHNERCCCYSFFFPWSLCFHGNIISEDNSCARIYSTHGSDTFILMHRQDNLFSFKLPGIHHRPLLKHKPGAIIAATLGG